jgi:hypothetical protein
MKGAQLSAMRASRIQPSGSVCSVQRFRLITALDQ